MNHFRSRGPNRPKTPTIYAFTCEIKVAPFTRTPGISAVGGLRWTWAGPGVGPMTTECGYRGQTEGQLLAHLIVTHRMPAAKARLMAGHG